MLFIEHGTEAFCSVCRNREALTLQHLQGTPSDETPSDASHIAFASPSPSPVRGTLSFDGIASPGYSPARSVSERRKHKSNHSAIATSQNRVPSFILDRPQHMVFGLSSMASTEPAPVSEADTAATCGAAEQLSTEQRSSVAHADQADAPMSAQLTTAASAGDVLHDQQEGEVRGQAAGVSGGAAVDRASSEPAADRRPPGQPREQTQCHESSQEHAQAEAQRSANAEEEERDNSKPEGNAALQNAGAEGDQHLGDEPQARAAEADGDAVVKSRRHERGDAEEDAAEAHDDAVAETEQQERAKAEVAAPGADGVNGNVTAEGGQHEQALPKGTAELADNAATLEVLHAAGESEAHAAGSDQDAAVEERQHDWTQAASHASAADKDPAAEEDHTRADAEADAGEADETTPAADEQHKQTAPEEDAALSSDEVASHQDQHGANGV